MSNEVTIFIQQEALKQKHTIYSEIFGQIELNDSKPIKQSSGSVYGIFVYSEEPIDKVKEIPNLPNWYPVYWGKDITPISRIRAHIANYEGTGNVALNECQEIQGKELIFGAIFVSNYGTFEDYLHKSFPSLLGKSSSGRSSTLIKIIN